MVHHCKEITETINCWYPAYERKKTLKKGGNGIVFSA
jgi:hypothetical protein